MSTITLTIDKQEELPILRLRGRERTFEEKVSGLVQELLDSPLFEKQIHQIHQWKEEALPVFKLIATDEEKSQAADYLSFLFIDVIFQAQQKCQENAKVLEMKHFQKKLETLLEPLLPPNVSPQKFLREQAITDKKTEIMVGQIAAVSSLYASKNLELYKEETVLNEELTHHHTEMKEAYTNLSSYAWEQAQGGQEAFKEIEQEIDTLHQNLTDLTTQVKELAVNLKVEEQALKRTERACQSVLNLNIKA